MFAHFFPPKKQPEEREEIPPPDAKTMPPINPTVSAAFNDFLAAQKQTELHRKHTPLHQPMNSGSLSGLNETLLSSSAANSPSSSVNFVDVLLHHPGPSPPYPTTTTTTTSPASIPVSKDKNNNNPSSTKNNNKAAVMAFLKLRDHVLEAESSERDALITEAHELFRHIWVNMQAERQQLQRVMSTDEALRLLSKLRREKELMEERDEDMRFTNNNTASPRHLHTVHFMEDSGRQRNNNPIAHQNQSTSPVLSTYLNQPPSSDEFISPTPYSTQYRADIALRQRGRLAAPQPKTSDRNAASRLEQQQHQTAVNSSLHSMTPTSTPTEQQQHQQQDEVVDTQSVPQKVKTMLDRRCSDMEKLQFFITNLETDNQKMQNALTFEQRRSEGLFQKAQVLQRKLQSTRQEALVWREEEREKMRVTIMEMEMRFERREQLLLQNNRGMGVMNNSNSTSRGAADNNDIDNHHNVQGDHHQNNNNHPHDQSAAQQHQFDVRDAFRKPIAPLGSHHQPISNGSRPSAQYGTPQQQHHQGVTTGGNIISGVTASSIGCGGYDDGIAERTPSWSIRASTSTHQPSNINTNRTFSHHPQHQHYPLGGADEPNERDLAALNVYLMERSKDPGNCVLFETQGYPYAHASSSPPKQHYHQLINNSNNGSSHQHQHSALTPSVYNNNNQHHHNQGSSSGGADVDVLRHYQQQWHYSLALTREFYRNKLDDESSSTSDLKSKLADAEIALKFKEGALCMKDNEISSLKNALQAFQQLSEEAVRGTKEGRYMYTSSTGGGANNNISNVVGDSLSLSPLPSPHPAS